MQLFTNYLVDVLLDFLRCMSAKFKFDVFFVRHHVSAVHAVVVCLRGVNVACQQLSNWTFCSGNCTASACSRQVHFLP